MRRRVALPDLKTEDFASADALFEQIANVERPKEFGCENGRGIDLNRWGFYYSDSRKEQLKQHMAYKLSKDVNDAKLDIKLEDIGNNSITSSMLTYAKGREYFPLAQSLLDANPHLSGNCSYKGIQPEFPYTVHPVVELSK